MKMAFVVCNRFFTDVVMDILQEQKIDYFTSWDRATGKGRSAEGHFGSGGEISTLSVTMIAFENDAPLEALIRDIKGANQEIPRVADHIRLFQLPLERIV